MIVGRSQGWWGGRRRGVLMSILLPERVLQVGDGIVTRVKEGGLQGYPVEVGQLQWRLDVASIYNVVFFIFQVGDVIVGRVTEVGQKRWHLDVASTQAAILMLSSGTHTHTHTHTHTQAHTSSD